ncbi:RDD family protein [Frondihabitans sucicola]|uniref:RDD family protein n=1 Tax=Frondihabitans sucicola TaxID=1268041 RepID=A0ABN6Y6D3_9MICO|nr:RDD family protein [Frondihabitans sucicola]BDZ51480.1 RDD family protein [Frondihabitans sucicola]
MPDHRALREAPPAFDAFVADDDELVTGEAVGLDVRPASFVLRLAGVVIDYVVYFLGLIGLLIVVSLAASRGIVDGSTATALVVAVIVLCLIVAPTAIETATQGKSLGKLAVGARVVRLDGGAIGFRHAFTRALVGLLEIVMTTGGIAVVVALLNGRSRRLGDLMAGTYALNERAPKESRAVYGVPVALARWSEVADVARLPDSLARRLSAFLQQAPRLTPESRMRVAAGLAAEASRYVSPLPASDPETFVAAVSAVRRDRELRALQGEAAVLARLEPALHGLPQGFPRR